MTFKKALKAFVLFFAVLSVVTVGAAIAGCLFLSNGRFHYLIHPPALFEFVWATRAGLKVTIFFVTLNIFFMFAADGALGRRWLKRSPREMWQIMVSALPKPLSPSQPHRLPRLRSRLGPPWSNRRSPDPAPRLGPPFWRTECRFRQTLP